MTNTASGSATRNVVPSEVGWQFVPQYYTFVNEHPERLHLFYNKKSTFIHGVEGEGGKPCHGQQEIHQKIISLGYSNCKVYIHSVDAQSSADGGIIIQVIGEMSNKNDDWRKFAQTFFLAQQPNGYFVLNDIFRFLKEESVEDDEEQAQQENVPAPAPTAQPPAEPLREPTPPPKAPTPPPPAVEEPPTTASDIPTSPVSVPAHPLPPSPRPNGVHAAEAEKPPSVPAPEQPAAPVEKARSPAPVVRTATPQAAPTPPPQEQQPVQATYTPPAQPAPAQPQQPKTWANLAAANSKKWGAAVAQESRGTSEVASSTPTASGTQTPTTPGPPQAPPAPRGGQGQVSAAIASLASLQTAQCFIKGVTEPISQAALTNTLTTRFGPIKDLDIVRNKACAFVEFTTIDAARRAIIASLPQVQGGEGGIWIEGGEGYSGQIRISVETRKERGDRPVPRSRGGAPDTGTGRGNANVGGGSSFRGRGGGTGRGGRSMGGK